jgi:uncharacterized membrane protein
VVEGVAVEHSRLPEHMRGAFGRDRFGRAAERFARFFGTPRFIVGQTLLVALWLLLNASELLFRPFDPYPFILLNLAFSTQAAYAAPLILLAQTRQADRDARHADQIERHREMLEQNREQLEQNQTVLLEQNRQLIERVEALAEDLRRGRS